MKFSIRLFLCITVLLSLSFASYGYWLLKEVRGQYAETVEDSLVDFSNIIASYFSTRIKDGEIKTTQIEEIFENFKRTNFRANIHGVEKKTSPINLYVTDQSGIVIFDSSKASNIGRDFSKWNDVYLTLRGKYGARSTRTDSSDPLSSVFYVASPIQHNGKVIGVVSVFKPAKSLRAFVSKGRRKIILITSFVLLLSILVSALFALWLSRPVNSLIRYAEKVAGGQSIHPPKLSTSDFNRLGGAFDKMRISLEGKKTIESYVQHLSHELKSPLTAIKAAAELLKDPEMDTVDRERFLQNIELESLRAKNQLEELLEISSLENLSGLKEKKPFNVSDLIKEIINSLAPLIESKDLKVKLSPQPSIIIDGDVGLVRKMLNNLLLNAIEFSPQAGLIEFVVEKSLSGIKIVIMDQGPGVPDFAKEKIFEKFYSLERPETGRKSSGLGLSLAQEVASLHGGKIKVLPSKKPYTGANFAVLWPKS